MSDRDRTRRLQTLTATLSGALDRDQVVAIMVDAGREALEAKAGFAWLLRDDAHLELAGYDHGGDGRRIAQFHTIEMDQRLPVCDVVRTGRPLMFESLAAMVAGYPSAMPAQTSVFRAWAVIPFVVAGRGVGAASFSFAEERVFSDEDRDLLAAMMGQASLALERCMLLAAERRARADAESARQRERQLHVIAARLSSALTPPQVAEIACDEVVAVLHAYSTAVSLRDGDDVHIIGTGGARDPEMRARILRMPLTTALPSAEAIRDAELVWAASEAELVARYADGAHLWRRHGVRSWGAVPFQFEGSTIGALALAFTTDHALSTEDREFLAGVGQLTGQALERARLYEALQTSEEQLRVALTAARAATWRLDLATMTAVRDAGYRALVGVREENAVADFAAVHPDDRPELQEQFERTLRDGAPFTPEVRVRRDDGTYMWVRSHGRLMYSPDGAPSVLAGVVVDIDEAKQASLRAVHEQRINETMHRLGRSFAAELDYDRLVQLITDELTVLVGAELGTFLFGVDPRGPFTQATVTRAAAGTDAGAMPVLPIALLGDSFAAQQVVRVGGFLAVPVVVRPGEMFGGLLLHHLEPDRFTPAHERLAASVVAQAAVALENARLYKTLREHKEQLESAVERARIADRRKDEFLAMLGHELRNPLAPIATALELMQLKDESALRKEREVIGRQVDHLSRLVDDLLDVSRITRGKIELARRASEIAAVLSQAIEMVSPLLEKHLQTLAVDVPRAGLSVLADPTRLAQVFHNLLMNAAKYSEPRSQIELRAYRTDDCVVVDVVDHGIGISPELMPRLFDLFAQGDRALDRSQGGLGIGLTIARSLCELHGGTITAMSAGLGKGSTFTVALPAGAPAELVPPAPRPRIARIVTGTRVLVVDDNIDAAETLRESLVSLGYELAVAHDGVAALDLAGRFRPDIAVLDIGLPVMDGYELARKLREHLGPHKLRLIAVTGYGQDSDRALAREAGFDHHLVKPVTLDALTPLLDSKN